MYYPIPYSVLQEFPELSREDVLAILEKHYPEDISYRQLVDILSKDAMQNFVNKPEYISRIVRKHLGRPEAPDITFYPEGEIENEINRRIRDIVLNRINYPYYEQLYKVTEIHVRKKILRVALNFSKQVKTTKQIDSEIEERMKLTGLSREQVIRCLYYAYFRIGIKTPEKAIEVKP